MRRGGGWSHNVSAYIINAGARNIEVHKHIIKTDRFWDDDIYYTAETRDVLSVVVRRRIIIIIRFACGDHSKKKIKKLLTASGVT